MTRRQVQRTKERGEVWGGGTRAVRSRERRGGERGRARRALVFVWRGRGLGLIGLGPVGPRSAPRQYYAATARVCCLCAITSSREIDERSEREWGRERRPGDGVRGVVRRDLRAAASMPLSRKPRLFLVTGEGASAQFLAMADPHADRRR